MEKTLHRPLPASPKARAKRLGALVESALIDEVTLSPKPGLVDVRGNGAHHDLDWTLMVHSAQTLRPAFEAMALAGAQIDSLLALRGRIGRLGREGEGAMLDATGGINTHRGAIWALGLLVTAAAQAPHALDAAAVANRAARLANIPDRFAPVSTGHKGERACNDYGVGGAKGQACAGFPHVIKIALHAWTRCSPSWPRWTTPACSHAVALMHCASCKPVPPPCVLKAGSQHSRAAAPSACSNTTCWRCTYPPAAQPTCWPPRCSSTACPPARTHLTSHPLIRKPNMEHLDFQFTGGAPAGRRAYAGVVGSGDLEVLLTPGNAGQIDVAITTSVNGMSATWQAQLARVFGSHPWPAAKITINDFGATPAVVRLRLEQALEALAQA